MATGWLSSGEVILDADGKIIVCDSCPCTTGGLCLLWNDNSYISSSASPGTFWNAVSQQFGLSGIVTHGAIGTPGYLLDWTGDIYDYQLIVLCGPISWPSWWSSLYMGSGSGTGTSLWSGRIVIANDPYGYGPGPANAWLWIDSNFGETGLSIDWTTALGIPPYYAICGLPGGTPGLVPSPGTPPHQLTDGAAYIQYGPTPAQSCGVPLLGGNNVYMNPNALYSTVPHIVQNQVDLIDWVLCGAIDIMRYGEVDLLGGNNGIFHYNLFSKPLA